MRYRLLALASACALAACSKPAPPAPSAENGPPRIVTSSGALVGSTDGGVVSFKGVPYAQPPVGDLRWAPPQPISWTGDRDATKFSLPCLQPTRADGKPNGAGVTGESSEDCLYLNVWAPIGAAKAPVMLWLYGGGGTMGGGQVPTYDGTAFARDGIVLVTINYRLGSLGGFAHPALTKAADASAGFGDYHLLDAIAALKWIRRNAAVFGGDPANVTLFGESAGATMTANLLTSPMAKGSFDRAIVESTGSLPTPATPLDKAEAYGVAFANAHGLPGADATLEQLREIPAADIMADAKTRGGLRTVLDGHVKEQSILDAFTDGKESDVPTIIGTNSDEGRLYGTQRVATFGEKGAPIFQYFFDYVATARRPDNPNGVPHAGELPFVFDTLQTDRRTAGKVAPEDQKVADYVHSCWVAFVKQPIDSKTITCANGFQWPARSEANNQAVAILQEAPKLGHAPDLKSPPNGAKPGPTSRDVKPDQ